MITMDPVINDDRTNCGLHEDKVITSFISSKCNNVYELSPKNQPCNLLYPKSPTSQTPAYGERPNCVAEKRKMPKYSTRSLYSSPALDYGSASDMANEMRSLDSLTTSITTSQIVTPQTSLFLGILKEDNLSPLSSNSLLPANNEDYNKLGSKFSTKLTLPWCNSVNTASTSSSITYNSKDFQQSDENINNFNIGVSSQCPGDKLLTFNHDNGICDDNLKKLTSPIRTKTSMAMKCFECSFSTLDRQEISKHYATAHSKDLRPSLKNHACSYVGPRRGSAPAYPISLNSNILRSSLPPSQTSLATSFNTLPKTFSVPSHKWPNDSNYGGELEPKIENNNELQCFECTFTTISKSSMISHYNTAHESLWSTYNCFLCDTSADSKPEIATHIYEQHFFRPSYDKNGVDNSWNLVNGSLLNTTSDNKNNILNTLFNRHSNPNKNYLSQLLQSSTGSLHKPPNGDKGGLVEWFYKNLTHFKVLHHKLETIFRERDFEERQYAGYNEINDVASLLTKIMSNPIFHDVRPSSLLMGGISKMYNIQNTPNLKSVRLQFKTKFGESWRPSTYLLFRKYFMHKIFKRNIASPFRRRSTIIKSGHRLDSKDKISEFGKESFDFYQSTPLENEDLLTPNANFVKAEVHFYCPLFHLYNTPAKRINRGREKRFIKKPLGLKSHNYINKTDNAFSPPPSSSATEVSNEVFEEPHEVQNSEQNVSLLNFMPLSKDTQGNPKLYPCPLRNKIGCPFKTRNKKRWADHLDHHNGLKNHSCKFCPYKTTWYENLKQHTKRMHGSASTMGQISMKSKHIDAKKLLEGSLDLNKGKLLDDTIESKRHMVYNEREDYRNTKSGVNKMNKRKSAPLKFVGREEKVARLEQMKLEHRDKTLSSIRNNLINKSIYPQMISRFRHATFPPVNAKRHTLHKHKISHGNYLTKFCDDIKKEQGSLATLLRSSKDVYANKINSSESHSPSAIINPLLKPEASINVASKQNGNFKRAYEYLVEMNDSFKRTSMFEDVLVNGKSRDVTKKGKYSGTSTHDSISTDQKISEDQRLDHLNAATACYREYLKRLASSNLFAPLDATASKDSQTNNPWNIFPYYLPPFNVNHQAANPDIGPEHMWMANHYHLPFMVPTTLTSNDPPSYPLLCTLCSIYFKTFPELMTHYQSIHGIMPPRPDYNNNDAIGHKNEKEGKYSPDHCNSEVSNILKRTTQEPSSAHQDMLHKNWVPPAPFPGFMPPPYSFNMAAAAAAFYNNPENVHAYTRMMYGKEQESTNKKNSRKSSTESQENGDSKHQIHKERLKSMASSTGSGAYVKNNYIKDHLRYMARKGSLTSDNTSESSSRAHAPEDTIRYEDTYHKDKSPSKSITPSTFQIENKNYIGTKCDFSSSQSQTDKFYHLNDQDNMEHTSSSHDEKVNAKSPVNDTNKVSKIGHNPSTHHRTGGNGLYCSAAASYLPTPESLLLVMSHAGSKQNAAGNANNNSPHLDFAEPRLASEHVSNLEGTILPGGLGPYDPLDPAHQQYLLSLGAAAGPNAKRQRTHRCTLPGCNFEAYDKNRMLDHLAAHRGEKPHGCPYCEFRTSWRFNIKNHIRSKHPNML